MHIRKRLANRPVFNVLLVMLCGCGVESPTDSAELDLILVNEQRSALQTASNTGCATVAAGDGWINRPVTTENGQFNVGWRSNPSGSSDGRPIDAVMGLSRDPAGAFPDLGPIMRFNHNGGIDARDGGAYVGGFPYTFGEGPYEFQLMIDVPQHKYSVWVRHLDSPFKSFEVLAQDAAFRTEQQSVETLGNLATIIDSPSGEVQTCGYTHAPASGCSKSGPKLWQSRPFTTLGNQEVGLDFYVWTSSSAVDAVVGASRGAPTKFSDLAAIVRFRPDGYIDARSGSSYSADTALSYEPNTYYHVHFEIDLGRSRYSVRVASPEQHSVVLARDYAFRTEQTGVTALDHLGQFVDSPAGDVNSCALVAR